MRQKTIKIKETDNKKSNPSKASGEIWDLDHILAGKQFDQWISETSSKVERFKRYRSQLNNNISPQKILEILMLDEEIMVGLSRIDAYYSLRFSADTKDPEALAKLGQIKQIIAQIANDTLYFNLWFMQMDEAAAKKIIVSKELKPYRYHLETIRKAKKYTKSEEIEKILQLKDITGIESFFELYNILTSSYKFLWEGKEANQEEVIKHIHSEDPKQREEAYKKVLQRYKEDETILTEIYKNIVTGWYIDGLKIRGFQSSIEIRNNSNDVSNKAVDTLLGSIRKNMKIFHEFLRLKYELNKKSGQKYSYSRYHLYAPFAIKNKKRYDYEYSKVYVLDTYKMFDQRFYERALSIFDDKHVHSHPTPSKRGGAFCYGITKEMSPYILLNHTDDLKSVFTMAHELGHGIHDIFAGERQTDLERHASLSVCETASVFGEMLLADRLLKESKDSEEKKQILVEMLNNQFATIPRQAYFVIFEKIAHEMVMQGTSKEAMEKKYYELLKEQFGDMEIPEIFKNEWNYVMHIYENPFYCYAYAWGNLFVLALYDMYKKEGKQFIEKYIELLSAGGSDSPANLMKRLGADPESEEFWQRGFNIIKEEIEELRKLVK